jgi:signal transduction histidine kinase
VDVQITALPRERLSESVEAAAYYMVAEALPNVAKHAGGTAATVTVIRKGDWAGVEVSDNGVGGAELTRGSGLRGLADRIEALGGRLEIQSAHGAGTRLLAEIPLSGPQSD